MVVHQAYIAGDVLYVHACPREAGTLCLHDAAAGEQQTHHRMHHYPAVPPQEFPGDCEAWYQYCATDALYRMSAYLRDSQSTIFLPLLADKPAAE